MRIKDLDIIFHVDVKLLIDCCGVLCIIVYTFSSLFDSTSFFHCYISSCLLFSYIPEMCSAAVCMGQDWNG